MQLNPEITPKRMQPGKVLSLPTVAEIAARKLGPVKAAVDASVPKTDAKVDPKADAKNLKSVEPLADEQRWYTVKKGDTYEGIAKSELGSGKRKDELMSLNPGTAPKDLRVGQRIKLPKK